MTSKIVKVVMDDSLEIVKQIFDNTKFHHLLVVSSNKKLVGVLSDRDYLKAVSPNLGTMAETVKDADTLRKRVHQVMTRKPVCLSPDDTIFDAVNVFNEHHFSCIPIVEEDNVPVGILSWRDIFYRFAEEIAPVEDEATDMEEGARKAS